MKIMPINNINMQQTQFRAKFQQKDIQEFLREIKINSDVDIVPKLYTMLDIIKSFPGEKASIEHISSWHRILIDKKSVSGSRKYFCAIHALKDATVEQKSTLIKESSFKRLSEEEFENESYKNSKKTIKDIENIFKG